MSLPSSHTPSYLVEPLRWDHLENMCATIKALPQGDMPQVLLVLGSGLGDIAHSLTKSRNLAYVDIPHFPRSSVVGHAGQLLYGYLGTLPCFIMSGRSHLYEGYHANHLALPYYAFAHLGVKTMIVTNAAGGIGDDLEVGDIMLIENHINLTGQTPSRGPHDPRFGARFFDVTEPYAASLRALAHASAKTLNIPLKQGIYASVPGPSYETAAEVTMLKILGASAIGMSTVLEVLAARHGGMEVLGLSTITNKAAGLGATCLDHSEVTLVGAKVSKKLQSLLHHLAEPLNTRH